MWKSLKGWLASVPIADPIERKSAIFLQLVLAYEGLFVPFNKIYRRWFVDSALGGAPDYGNYAILVDNLTDAGITVAAWVAFALVRRGNFRGASITILATMWCSMLLAYATFGYAVMPTDETAMEVLVLATLLLGKRALWTTFGVICGSLLLAMTRDAIASGDWSANFWRSYNEFPSVGASYVAITLFLNQLNYSLRSALSESEARGRALRQEVAARERSQAALLHTRKLEAVGQLASGVAHDFNNVLGVIQGYARERFRVMTVRASQGDDVERLQDALEGIEEAADRGAAVTGRLLGFSRRDTGAVEVVDLAAVCASLTTMLRQLLPPTVRLQVAPPSQPLFVRVDRNELDLAFLDIASNARDAMPRGGCFSVTVTGGACVTIQCSDTGTGIEPSVIERVTEPFFTTKGRGQGTGLGLSTVYGMLRRVGGDLRITSVPGQGTTIAMILPHADEPDDQVSVATSM
ncbi:His Kinase A (phospho-acceptor) domain-containing protein [Luteibacter sp. UNC138MFCol5.1]|uniref:sensor histidine kinase n=1 Tax=Luteibacter sp. UNC138MFCol5.1 TaxID=1502774 RepID=UPI0008B64241|nr:ATP-binding protein [Luteibacter sp. UNC138MFCol5.1]SEP00078.1 His Kinase A (phospho-acceptor) domain-containing protein [Luteibacter sp. UNC138MFCol5.1]